MLSLNSSQLEQQSLRDKLLHKFQTQPKERSVKLNAAQLLTVKNLHAPTRPTVDTSTYAVMLPLPNLLYTRKSPTEFHKPENPMPKPKHVPNNTRTAAQEVPQEVAVLLCAPTNEGTLNLPNDYMELISNTTYFSITF